jgi:hypothetical protein
MKLKLLIGLALLVILGGCVVYSDGVIVDTGPVVIRGGYHPYYGPYYGPYWSPYYGYGPSWGYGWTFHGGHRH